MNKLFNPVFRTFGRTQFNFSSAKNKQIELTLRTPYRNLSIYTGTIVENFSNFSKIITKDLHSVVVIENRSPPALHVLPPGSLRLKLTG